MVKMYFEANIPDPSFSPKGRQYEPSFLPSVYMLIITYIAFVDILASMRTGILSSAHLAQLRQLSRPVHYADGIQATEL
jgi:hypothetical protein